MMDKFVCVRIIQGWGMDLSVFQFDQELTWAVFFMNADKTVYGRYGSRSDHKDTQKHISMASLKKATQAALDLHAGYPGNKKEFAGKTGPAPIWKTPESIPELRGKPNMKPADGTRGGCIHCHQSHDGEAWSLRNGRQPVPDKNIWAYPMPDRLGISLDPNEKATVTAVAAGSPAEKGGFKAGDQIVKFEGQPILSIADVQWVLHNAKDGATLKADVDRSGQKAQASVALATGWRQKEDFTWRVIVWSMRHRLLGTEPLVVLSSDEKKKIGIADSAMALRIKGFPPDWVKDKNKDAAQKLQKDDVIVEVDGKKTFASEGEMLGYLMQKKAPGDKANFMINRAGKNMPVAVTIP